MQQGADRPIEDIHGFVSVSLAHGRWQPNLCERVRGLDVRREGMRGRNKRITDIA
jgi:hypothetical protein